MLRRKIFPYSIVLLLMIAFVSVAQADSLDVSQGAPDVMINEVMYDPQDVPDADGEWIELYNNGATDVNINGWTVSTLVGPVGFHVLDFGGVYKIPAGGYAVLCSGAGAAAFCDYAYGSDFSLANFPTAEHNVVLTANNGRVVDVVSYGEGFPRAIAASLCLESPEKVGNRQYLWNVSTADLGMGGSDKGSPGAENVDCPNFGPFDAVGSITLAPPPARGGGCPAHGAVVPAAGGTIDICGELTNLKDVDVTTAMWAVLSHPDATVDVVFQVPPMPFLSGVLTDGTISYVVDAAAPAGEYTYTLYIGDGFPAASDALEFSFTKDSVRATESSDAVDLNDVLHITSSTGFFGERVPTAVSLNNTDAANMSSVGVIVAISIAMLAGITLQMYYRRQDV